MPSVDSVSRLSIVYHALPILVEGVLKEAGTAYLGLLKHLDSPSVFGRLCVSHPFSFVCSVLCFVCLRPVSCVPSAASVSGLSILDCPFGFLWFIHS